ncbi:flippase [Evansella sp. AB-P1]|uniref:flippase n=1 Tax=Evansella sp. AB-P1 TaxID=3037653 RepID=UPI00241EE149|nr:flippase [Evansella sp. AB-P1]MDG5789308.1 flippase [Evansella sp. AB-P1]
MGMKERSTIFNIISTLSTKFILLFGGFIISIILARLLGPEGKGIITAIFVFPLLIVSLADMGIRQASAYFIGKKKYEPSDIVSSIAFLWLITSLFSMLMVFVYFLIGPSNNYHWIILMIAIGSVPIKLINQYSKGVMQGFNQISTINLSQIIQLLSNFSGVLLLVWLFDLGILGAALTQIAMAFSVAVYYLFKISKHFKIRIKAVGDIPKSLFMKGVGFAAALFIINLNYKVDIMILDFMVNPDEIGLYAVGVSFAELLWQVPSAVGMVLFAKSATTKNTVDSVTRSTTILRMVLPIMALASIIIGLFAPYLISLLYGIEFAGSGSVLRILLPGVILITVSKILHPDLAARGYPLYALRVFIITLVINLILNFILIPKYGINGAALASTLSYFFAGIGFGFVYSRREKISMKELFFIKKQDITHVKDIVKKKLNRKR